MVCQWRLLDVEEAVRRKISAERPESVLASLASCSGSTWFVASQHRNFLQSNQQPPFFWAGTTESCDVIQVGPTSLHVEHVSKSTKTGDHLSTGTSQLALVDKNSGEFMNIPRSLREECLDLGIPLVETTQLFHQLSKPSPGNCHVVSIAVQSSDTDFNQQTSQASYMKFCHDAASVLCKNGKLKSFEGDLAFVKMLSLKCQFHKARSDVGDVLEITVWEEGDGRTLNCIAEKEGSVLAQCVMQFDPKEKLYK